MAYYFDKNTNVKSNEVTTRAEIGGKLYTFKTDNNVFSKKGLDFGTRTLLESIDIKNISGDVLDFGCGYGPIGIYIKSNTEANVDMIDVNERALNLARSNASINKINVNIFESDIYSNVEKKYDYIITNPPIRVGKKILYEILIKAKEHLKENGHLIFVINKDQGAKSTMRDMEEYYSVKLIEKNKGFYVIDCQNH
ncbi:MAG: class I SAM-dependent methyltransferase [Firmicutes bacterium]|nr:class I SAM-dependent methyltransferase [Bacillota bacterium]